MIQLHSARIPHTISGGKKGTPQFTSASCENVGAAKFAVWGEPRMSLWKNVQRRSTAAAV